MDPSYLEISSKALKNKIRKLFDGLRNCQICPRKCQVNRLGGQLGFCKLGEKPIISAYHPHFGEEKVLVGKQGSGTIFFTSCNLACVYCQNYEISQFRVGEEISFEDLAGIMVNLQKMGCHNINLVTPSSQVPAILKALPIAKDRGLRLPLVYNTNSYDSVETLKLLDGIIDIYMPDTKYSDNKIASKYSGAPGYFEIMKEAIKEMHRQVGDLVINEEGIAVKGLLVRHLVLPNNLAGTKEIVEFLTKEVSPDTFINIMEQYYPHFRAEDFPELNRPITPQEYFRAIELTKIAGLKRIYTEHNF